LASRQSQVKAQLCSQPSGFVEIVHPFHPLFRQQFALLKSRTVLGVECVTLKGSLSGTFSVPKNWTSIRVSDHYEDAGVPPTILRLERLIELARLVDQLSKSVSSKKLCCGLLAAASCMSLAASIRLTTTRRTRQTTIR
jgi:Family of unknown function (DUF5372)